MQAPSTAPGLQEETLAAYERELQARDQRIEELERRLTEAEERHRLELAASTAALGAAEAELVLLRPLRQQDERNRASGGGDEVDAPLSPPELSEDSQRMSARMGGLRLVDALAETDATSADAVEEGPSSMVATAATSPRAQACSEPGSPLAGPETGPVDPTEVAALAAEYGRSTAELQLLAREVAYYKQLAVESQRAKAEETLAAREAATAAVQACLRRADCEQELGASREEVRELHRRLTDLQFRHDDEVRRNYALRARLQLYAERISAMEVEFSLSMCQLEEEGLAAPAPATST